jgi:hypothetical protein
MFVLISRLFKTLLRERRADEACHEIGRYVYEHFPNIHRIQGAAERFVHLFSSPDHKVVHQTVFDFSFTIFVSLTKVWTLGNISEDSAEKSDFLLRARAMLPLIDLLHSLGAFLQIKHAFLKVTFRSTVTF